MDSVVDEYDCYYYRHYYNYFVFFLLVQEFNKVTRQSTKPKPQAIFIWMTRTRPKMSDTSSSVSSRSSSDSSRIGRGRNCCPLRHYELKRQSQLQRQHQDQQQRQHRKCHHHHHHHVLLNLCFVILVSLSWFITCCDGLRRLPDDNHRFLLGSDHGDEYESGNESYSDDVNVNDPFTNLSSSSSSSIVTSDGIQLHPEQQQQPRRKLLGTNVNVPIPDTPDGHLVTDLPLLDPATFQTKHWAGLLPSSPDGDKYFFYWLFAPDMDNQDDNGVVLDDDDIPLIVWLNGGPACSSMDGLFIENGPFRLQPTSDKKGWKIVSDPYSWHKSPAYVVYIDQPVGTGISFTTSGKYPRNDIEVNVDFYYFLQEFLHFHSDKFILKGGGIENNDSRTMKRGIYFSGESHAGHYIPSMMNNIRKQNQNIVSTSTSTSNNKNHNIYIPLKGAAIGNGWFDPRVQYSGHEAAYGYGIIGRAQKNALAEKEKLCQQDIANQKYVSNNCFSLLDEIIDNSQGKSAPYEISQYDVSKWESTKTSRKFPPGHEVIEAYLGGWNVPHEDGPEMPVSHEVVLESIHSTPSLLSGQRYKECTNPPYNALKHQDGLGVTGDIVELLNYNQDGSSSDDTKITLLFFNGLLDLICNHVGNEIALENLQWKYQKEYVEATRYGWKSNLKNQLAGYVKQYSNLIFLKVKDSGHMVPMDVPDVALEMMRELIYGKTDSRFHSYRQDIDRRAATGSCPLCPTPSSTCQEDGEQPSGQKTSEVDDLSSTVMNRERIWIGILLAIIGVMSCWIVFGGSRFGTRRNRYQGFGSNGARMNGSDGGITAHKSEMVELTVANGGYSD